MIRDQSFRRKIIYFSIMALLLIPLYLVGAPDKMKEGRVVGSGLLAQMRNEHGLSQVTLGEIDPASETMKLATLGMRGVAANILWSKANHYKKTEQFDKMEATVDQLMKFQPNFVSVWEFHAHNMSYNTSVEFDDYKFRYHWVKKGVAFLIEGTRYNRDEPIMLWNIGWYLEQKIGRSDETAQFRPMFREDEDFHALLGAHVNLDDAAGPDLRPDNWKVGYLWMCKAQEAADAKGLSVKGKAPHVFHSSPSMALMYYAMAIEEEGYLDDVAREAWKKAAESWQEFGSREFTRYGTVIRLNDLEELEEKAERLERELDELAPGVRQRLRQQRIDALDDPKQREAIQVPEEQRTEPQRTKAAVAEEKIKVTNKEVAGQAPRPQRPAALSKAAEIHQTRWRASIVRSYRDQINFDFWRTRSEAEQTDHALRGRKYVYDADEAFDDARLVEAKELYELAWKEWAVVFEKYPALLEDVAAEDLVASINRYRICLEQNAEPFPKDFKLRPLLDLYDTQRAAEERRRRREDRRLKTED